MIQRIQSVYLLVVALLLTVCLCNPIATSIFEGNSSHVTNLYAMAADGTKDYAPWALFALLLLAALLAFGTIFLFKKRMLQIRLTIFNTVVLVGYYATLIALICLSDWTDLKLSWTICLPFVGIILNWLAIRAIGKDEMLVKAYERLR